MNLTTDQTRAVHLLNRYFGMNSGNAAARVLLYTDDEVAAFVAAGAEPQYGELHPTPGEMKVAMKGVLSRIDESRNADQGHAGDAIRSELVDRNNVRDVLLEQYGLSADQAAEVQGSLNFEQQAAAANLVTRHDCRPVLDELLGPELVERIAALKAGQAA